MEPGGRSIAINTELFADPYAQCSAAKIDAGCCNDTVMIINSGQVKVKVKKVDNAKYYEFQFALSPVKDDVWQHTSTPGCTDTLMGLIRVKEYDIRVCAVGSKGVRGYSDPITILVI